MEEKIEKTDSTVNDKTSWEKLKESRLFAGLITGLAAIAGAGIMYVATLWVGEKEARSRTYDLLSNREIAANNLQAKVFEIYVQHVVPALEEEGNDHKKVALLAGLHSNFSEFFDTRSVFAAFAEVIKDPIARHELTRLAKRVARRQAEFIKAHADTTENTKSVKWTLKPGDSTELDFPGHSGTLLIKEVPRRYYDTEHAKEHIEVKPALEDNEDDLIDDVSDFVKVELKFTGENGGPFTFELSYMDTPYMDNIWMLHGNGHHQIALRLLDIDTKDEVHKVTIEVLHFPGDVYAATQRLPAEELLQGGHKHED